MVEKVQELIRRLAVGGLPQAAHKSGLDQGLLEEALTGSFDRWTTAMVEKVAHAAGLDPAVVWSSAPLPEVPTVGFLRGAWPDFNEADVPVLHQALNEAASLRALAVDVLGNPLLFKDADRVPVAEPAFANGYRLAQLVRERLNNRSGLIPDIHRVAAGVLHVHVLYRPLLTLRLHAVSISSREGSAVVVNSRIEQRGLMLRRTIAHELSHALFDPYAGNLATALDDDLDGNIDGSPVERRARAFAAELLVPEAGLREVLGVPGRTRQLDVGVESVRTVSAAFWAPPELVAYHLVNRRYVDPSLRDRLVESVRGVDPSVDDPHEDWLETRVAEAVEAELISANRAKEILGLSVYDRDLVA
jgi:Zn-dependent peptidase ImmA (M78 family)